MTHHAPVGIGAFRGADPATLRGLIERAADRIDLVEPDIAALLPETNRRERMIGELNDLGRAAPGPLSGVPVGVKDIFRVDGWATHAGSRLPPELFAGDESIAVSRLKAAGAIILGKTVTTEFAYFGPGPTRNPWNTDHTPGGSSSGSAAAVSAGYCPIALGTQTIGSIGRPASFCGVVGFKPSYGRVPTEGVVPFSVSADHIGVIAADVDTAAVAASVLWDDWTGSGSARGGAGRVVLVVDDAYSAQADDEIRAAVDRVVSRLEEAGWRAERVSLFDDIADINGVHGRMVARDFADVHAAWVRDHEALYSQRSLELIATGSTVAAIELEQARRCRQEVRERIDAILRDHGAACIVSPSAPGAAPAGIDSTGSPMLNLPWTYAGVPTVTLPAALASNGLPLGVQLAGAFGTDERLIGTAAQIERLIKFKSSR